MISPLTVRRWSETEFSGSRELWQGVLSQSDADPLFMSWDWQWRWWHHHAEHLHARLYLLGIYTAAGRLIGLAPFYVREVQARIWLKTVRLEVNGLAWRTPSCVFSEYLDLIVAREHVDEAVSAVSAWLKNQRFWHELVFPYTARHSLLSRLAGELQTGHVRQVDPLDAYCVRLPAKFDDYLRALSSSTRRRAFNQRSKLEKSFLEYAEPANVDAFLEGLWAFRGHRWGAVEGPAAREFHRSFARAMLEQGCLQLSRLVSASRPISYLYNLRISTTEYYLQSGFEYAPDQGVSPGYLHLGYALEAASGAGCEKFDLLAGGGRHRDYKQDFGVSATPLVCHQVVRAWWLRALYALHTLATRRPG